MTATEYRDSAKLRLGLSDTTFDTELDDFVTQAVNRLAPKAMIEVDAEDVTVTVDTTGETNVDLATDLSGAIDDVRKVEAYDGVAYFEVTEKYRHASTLTVRGLSTDVTKLKIYGLDEYSVTEVPNRLELAVIWYIMAEFYDLLASNKAKYNIYQQTNGARGVTSMRDESVYFESKAEVFLDEHSTAYGS